MQNKDLSRFFPDNPKTRKAFQFVRYNEKGEIEGISGGGSVPVGTLKLDHVPTDLELNAYVESKTGREVQANDSVIVVVTTGGKTTTYNYYYTENGWDNYELTGVDLSANGVAGIVSGTYGISNYEVLLDIQDGEVINIYVNSDNGYLTLKAYLESIAADVSTVEGELTKQSLEVLNIASRKWNTSSAYAGFGYVAEVYLGEFTDGPYLASSNAIINVGIDPNTAKTYGIVLKEIYHTGNDYYARFLAMDKPTSTIVIKLVCLWNAQFEEYPQPAEPTPTIPEGALFSEDGDQLLGVAGNEEFELLIEVEPLL